MKKIVTISFVLIFSFGVNAFAINGYKNEAEQDVLLNSDFDVNAKSALLMEASTGKIL